MSLAIQKGKDGTIQLYYEFCNQERKYGGPKVFITTAEKAGLRSEREVKRRIKCCMNAASPPEQSMAYRLVPNSEEDWDMEVKFKV